jgi:hypothetical protein
MAEIYTKGHYRIFYRSTAFTELLVVLVDLVYKDLSSILCQVQLSEVGGGLYYFDCLFHSLGAYVGKFYENGVLVSTQNFLVVREGRSRSGNLLS